MRWNYRNRILLGVAPVLLAGLSACGGDDDGTGPSPNRVATVEITPAADTIQIQATFQFTATLRNSAGDVLAGHYRTWAVTDSTLAQVTLNGIVRALAPGVIGVIATAEGKSDTATVTLAPVLTLGPRLPSLFVGDTLQLGATLTDVLGGTVSGSVTWTVRDPGTAGIVDGVVTGVNTGFATVVASTAGAAESVVVAVLRPRIGVNREIGYLLQIGGLNSLFTFLPGDTSGKPVSSPASEVFDYSWSPDGARVAVAYNSAYGGLKKGLFLLDADGGGEQQIGTDDGDNVSWSPTENGIAYATRRISKSMGAGVQVFAPTGHWVGTIYDGALPSRSPQWSPDGRQIAFTRGLYGYMDQLWVADADGSRQRQLPVPVWAHAIRWSPDGKLIAIQGKVPWGSGGAWVVRPDGTGFLAISPNCTGSQCSLGDAILGQDAWSPDGSSIAMSDGYGSIHLWSRATGAVHTLALVGADLVAWSPDGQKLAFINNNSGCDLGLLGVMDADGSNQVPLHFSLGSCMYLLTWRP